MTNDEMAWHQSIGKMWAHSSRTHFLKVEEGWRPSNRTKPKSFRPQRNEPEKL